MGGVSKKNRVVAIVSLYSISLFLAPLAEVNP